MLLHILEGLLVFVSVYSSWQTYVTRGLRRQLTARQFLINTLMEQLHTAQEVAATFEREHGAQRTLTRSFADVLRTRDELIQALYTYQRTLEHQTMEQREEIEEYWHRLDIITEGFQSIIDQRNQRIDQLILEIARLQQRGLSE